MRQVNLREDVIWKFRVNELCDRELFVSVDRDEDALRETNETGLRLGPAARFRVQTRAAQQPAPVASQSQCWSQIGRLWVDSFKIKFDSHIPSSSLPAQSFFKSFEEMLADGTMKR